MKITSFVTLLFSYGELIAIVSDQFVLFTLVMELFWVDSIRLKFDCECRLGEYHCGFIIIPTC